MKNLKFKSIGYRTMNMFLFIVLIVLGFLLPSCYKKIDSNLNIKVLSYSHEAIDKANIYLDNESLGETNEQGEFVVNKKLNTKRHELMVKKYDDKLSFSTYKQYIRVSEENKDLYIEVVLFSVPKGSFSQRDTKEGKKDNNDKNLDVESNTESDSLVQESNILEKDLGNEKTNTDEEDTDSEFSSEDNSLNLDMKENLEDSKYKSVTIYFQNKSGTPLDFVNVSYKSADNLFYEPGCSSDETGRCFLKYTGKDKKVKILYQKDSYQSLEDEIELENEKTFTKTLQEGKSLDIQVYTEVFGKKIPKDASIYINNKKVSDTKEGFYSFKFKYPKTKSVYLGVKTKQETKSSKVDVDSGSKMVQIPLKENQDRVKVAFSDLEIIGVLESFNKKEAKKQKDSDLNLNLKEEYLELNNKVLKTLYGYTSKSSKFRSIDKNGLKQFTKFNMIPVFEKIGGWTSSKYSPDLIIVPSLVLDNKKDSENYVLLSVYNSQGKKQKLISLKTGDSVGSILKTLKEAIAKLENNLFSNIQNKEKSYFPTLPKERLSFINTYPKSKIFVDNSFYGESPLVTYLPKKNISIKIEADDKEYKTIVKNVDLSKIDFLYAIGHNSFFLEKDYLGFAKDLLKKDRKEALAILEKIPESYSYYPEAIVTLSKLLLEDKEYKKVLEKTSFVLKENTEEKELEKIDPTTKITLFILNNISSVEYAGSLGVDSKQEALDYYIMAVEDGKEIFTTLSKIGGLDEVVAKYSDSKEIISDFWYYQGLAYLNLWQMDKKQGYKDKLIEIWQKYLNSKYIDQGYSKLPSLQKDHVRNAKKLFQHIQE